MPRILLIVFAAILVVIAATVGRSYMMGPSTSGSAITIGGPFALTDHTGKAVTDKDYRGKYMLVYFGYTFCPDVCPTSLSIIGQALDQMSPEQVAKIQPLFISVDPDRDTPEVMASYVPHFHEKIIGLTGPLSDIKSLSKAYKSFFAKSGSGEDYTVDHMSRTYVMGPDGAYITHFNHATPPEEMARRLADIL